MHTHLYMNAWKQVHAHPYTLTQLYYIACPEQKNFLKLLQAVIVQWKLSIKQAAQNRLNEGSVFWQVWKKLETSWIVQKTETMPEDFAAVKAQYDHV